MKAQFVFLAYCFFFQSSEVSASVFDPASTSKSSPSYSDFNHVDQLGGIGNIDKITKIRIWTGCFGAFCSFTVVAKIEVTYRKTNGDSMVLTEGGSDDFGSPAAIKDFADGVYCKRIQAAVGGVVDWIRICDTNDDCTNKIGGKTDEPASYSLSETNAVIVALHGDEGIRVDNVGVYYRYNQLYRISLRDVTYTATSVPVVTDNIGFQTPDAKVTLDNTDPDSTNDLTATLDFTEEVSRTETTSVTTTERTDFSYTYSATAGVSFVAASVEATQTFSAGKSLEKAFTEETTETYSQMFGQNIEIIASPGQKVTATMYFSEVTYTYSWNGPIDCYYAHAPTDVVTDCDELEGTFVGTQPFQDDYIDYDVDSAFTAAPGPSPSTSAPTQAPSVCFSGETIVHVEGPSAPTIPMKDLKVGDSVLTKYGTSQPVYAWAHIDPKTPSDFLQVHTTSTSGEAQQPLEMSKDHMVYVVGRAGPICADSIAIGDVLMGGVGHGGDVDNPQQVEHKVINITKVRRIGLYAPLTPDGTVLVSTAGIVASNYIAVQVRDDEYVDVASISLPLLQASIIHMFLSPLRLWCMGVSSNLCTCHHDHDGQGMHFYVAFGINLVRFAEKRSFLLQLAIFSLVIVITGAFMVIELAFGPSYGPLFVLLSIAGVWACHKKMMMTMAGVGNAVKNKTA